MMPVVESAAQALHSQKQAAIEAYRASRQPSQFFERYTAALDQLLGTLWQEFFSGSRLALLATGGFGRAEVYPFSDVDLAIVAPDALTDQEQEQISTFVQTLWDIQLAPAIKTGSLAELCQSARDDLTADTAFIEARFICGDHQLADRFLHQLSLQRNIALFIEGKLLEMQQRHNKQQGSGAVLEPNVKTCPGGLRDIHTMLWLAKAQGLDAHMQALITNRVLTRAEAGHLVNSHKQLAKIRIELHLAAGREEDRLVFDLQTKVADNMGLRDDDKRRKSEKLMHQLYRATKTVKQFNGIILPMLRGRVFSILPRVVHQLDDDYYQVGNQVASYDKDLFAKQPEHVFRILEIIQKSNGIITIAPRTLRNWWEAARKINHHFYNNPENRKRFIGFFKDGTGLTHTMRFLNLYGALGHYLPAWGKIVGLLQHDLFHIYPVDDHILMVLRNMRRLALDEHAHELPFASGLMHSFEPKYVLYLAAMFHDIAKGRGGDHAIQGIADARQFAADHFMSEEDSDLLAWLVEDHLLMSLTAQKEDIQNPDVIKRFCERVKTPQRLRALYLLTVADIRGTNPKIWNSWKASLLENLFNSANRYFSGGESNRAVIASQRQMNAMDALTDAGYDTKQQRRLWQALGPAYFVRHEENEILWHLPQLIDDVELSRIAIRRYDAPNTLQVMVYMPNTDRLFTRLCRIFSHQGLDIMAARAFVTEHNYILDTFVVQFPANSGESDYRRIQRALERELNDFLQGIFQDDNRACGIRSRRARHLPINPSISIVGYDDSPGWHTMNIVAVNRPYLLADITEVLSDFNISLRYAKIATLDERVEDSFSLFSRDLENPQKQLELKRVLFEQLTV